MRRHVRPPFALAVAALSACGQVTPSPSVAPRPDELVIVHFDPPRTVLLERGPGDTVRVRDATSVLGRLRESRGDTAWIAATRVRAPHDDGQGLVPGWRVAVVNDARTHVVPLSSDTHGDGAAVGVGATVVIAAALAVVAVDGLLALLCYHSGSRCLD